MRRFAALISCSIFARCAGAPFGDGSEGTVTAPGPEAGADARPADTARPPADVARVGADASPDEQAPGPDALGPEAGAALESSAPGLDAGPEAGPAELDAGPEAEAPGPDAGPEAEADGPGLLPAGAACAEDGACQGGFCAVVCVPAFRQLSPYEPGDLVVYAGGLWQCAPRADASARRCSDYFPGLTVDWIRVR